jgi:hypothetical protein
VSLSGSFESELGGLAVNRAYNIGTVLAGAFDNLMSVIKPSGHLAFGGTLFYGIQKFFKEVEEKLKDDTKLEIAVWLVGVKTADKVPWPETFAKLFDRVFGAKHLSWKCFFRSCCFSSALYLFSLFTFCLFSMNAAQWRAGAWHDWTLLKPIFIGLMVMGWMSFPPDYISLLKSRYLIRKMSGGLHFAVIALFLLLDAFLTLVITVVGFVLGVAVLLSTGLDEPFAGSLGFAAYGIGFLIFGLMPMLCSGYFTSIWLWLYVGSGFLLKAARRFDIGFDWFNRKFDIEKKPLQSIGLVSGAIVAVLYWTVAVVSRVI